MGAEARQLDERGGGVVGHGSRLAELAVREPEDVALYARIFDMDAAAALHGEAGTKLITRIALEL